MAQVSDQDQLRVGNPLSQHYGMGGWEEDIPLTVEDQCRCGDPVQVLHPRRSGRHCEALPRARVEAPVSQACIHGLPDLRGRRGRTVRHREMNFVISCAIKGRDTG